MRLIDSLGSAFEALRAHKLRSVLTMLGIVIGVGAVIATVSIGGGAREEVVGRIRSLGANLLIVIPGNVTQGGVRLGTGQSATLSDDDARAIEAGGVPGAGGRTHDARWGAGGVWRHQLGHLHLRRREQLLRGARVGR